MCLMLFLLTEAVVAVEKVASHINEMQRITERFAPVFNQIVEEYGAEVRLHTTSRNYDNFAPSSISPKTDLHRITL